MLEPQSLAEALAGVDTAYYLVHSLGTAKEEFRENERISAQNFAEAARNNEVRRIVYLGGLGRSEDGLSPTWLAARTSVAGCAKAGPRSSSFELQ